MAQAPQPDSQPMVLDIAVGDEDEKDLYDQYPDDYFQSQADQ